MKKYFISTLLIVLTIVSCSPQKEISKNKGGEPPKQETPKPKTTGQIITELKSRVDSLYDLVMDYKKESKNVFDSTMFNGALGDVKYSVLPPGEFFKINGKDCWRLLDSTCFVGTDLHRITRNTGLGDTLPDGRGVFIRGMMFNKKDTITGDQDKIRIIGKFQKDQVGSHDHQFIGFTDHSPLKASGQYHWLPVKQEEPQSTIPMLPQETRPKNIALYIYIRVNYLCSPGK